VKQNLLYASRKRFFHTFQKQQKLNSLVIMLEHCCVFCVEGYQLQRIHRTLCEHMQEHMALSKFFAVAVMLFENQIWHFFSNQSNVCTTYVTPNFKM